MNSMKLSDNLQSIQSTVNPAWRKACEDTNLQGAGARGDFLSRFPARKEGRKLWFYPLLPGGGGGRGGGKAHRAWRFRQIGGRSIASLPSFPLVSPFRISRKA
jgi:hypothetical protein